MRQSLNQINEKAKLFCKPAKFQVLVLRDEQRPIDFELLPLNCLYIYRSTNEFDKNLPKEYLLSNNQKFVKRHRFKGTHFANKNLKNFQKSKSYGLLSVSAHSFAEILKAIKYKPDFILYSPIFKSQSQSAAKPKGIIKLMGITRAFKNANIYALGGVNLKTVRRLKNTNIKGIAGVSFRI